MYDEKKEVGQQELIPITEADLELIVRPERNLERWSNFLFPHARAKNLDRKRVKQWTIKVSEDLEVEASLAITPIAGGKAFTYSTYDVYLAIVSIFYEQGMPSEDIVTSFRHICRTMEVPMNGYWADRIQEELYKLKTTNLEWALSYKTQQNTNNPIGETVKNQSVLTAYDYSKIKERPDKSTLFKTTIHLRFHHKIRENLINNIVTPVNWAQRKKISSQIAKVLFSRVDNILAGSSTSIWSRTGLNLLDDLQMSDNDRYIRYKSERKKILVRLEKDLHKAILSDGLTLNVILEETVDKDDYKLTFYKSGKKKAPKLNIPIVNNDPAIIEYLTETIGKSVGDIENNYALYKRFAMHYSDTLIYRALGEWKEEIKLNPSVNKTRFFTVKMHAIAHNMGKEWIKSCKKDCKYRPENRLSFNF